MSNVESIANGKAQELRTHYVYSNKTEYNQRSKSKAKLIANPILV